MSNTPKYNISAQFVMQKKFLAKANLTKRNKIVLKSERYTPYSSRLRKPQKTKS